MNFLVENGRPEAPSKLPAANSRSGSTEGYGANGNLLSTGVLSVVCGFSSKLDVKKWQEEKSIVRKIKKREIISFPIDFSEFW